MAPRLVAFSFSTCTCLYSLSPPPAHTLYSCCTTTPDLLAKVADFGTSRVMAGASNAEIMGGGSGGMGGGGSRGGFGSMGNSSHHSTRVVVGTTPYMPGEYLQVRLLARHD
jgi:hypothetical protein